MCISPSSWLKDSEYIPDGVVTTHGRSVLSLSVEKNATLTCTVEGEDGITSSNARVLIAEGRLSMQYHIKDIIECLFRSLL